MSTAAIAGDIAGVVSPSGVARTNSGVAYTAVAGSITAGLGWAETWLDSGVVGLLERTAAGGAPCTCTYTCVGDITIRYDPAHDVKSPWT